MLKQKTMTFIVYNGGTAGEKKTKILKIKSRNVKKIKLECRKIFNISRKTLNIVFFHKTPTLFTQS